MNQHSDKKRHSIEFDHDETIRLDVTSIHPQGGKYEADAEDLSLILNIQNESGKNHTNKKSPGKVTFDDFFEESLKNDKNLLDHIVETDPKQERSVNKSGSRVTREKDSFGNSREVRRLDRPRAQANSSYRPNSVAKFRKNKNTSDSGKKNQLLDDSSKHGNSRGTPDTTTPFISPTALMTPFTGRMTKGQLLARQMQASKPCYFNLLCIGREKVGKSSFLERLIFKAFGKKSVIDRNEKGFVEHITERRDGNRRYILNVIDSKGYSEDYPVDQWFADVKKLIKGKYAAYENLKVASKESKDKHLVDPRIHLCLYFIDSETRLNVKDILHLKKLKKLVNIIPVMVGNDPEVDSEEIEAYKDRLNKDARDYEIEWLNLHHEVESIHRIIDQNSLQPIAPCPPFWYQQSFDEDTDPAVFEDFNLLSLLIGGPISDPLRERTEVIYAIYMDNEKHKQQEDMDQQAAKNANLGVGIALGMGALGFIMAMKNKMF